MRLVVLFGVFAGIASAQLAAEKERAIGSRLVAEIFGWNFAGTHFPRTAAISASIEGCPDKGPGGLGFAAAHAQAGLAAPSSTATLPVVFLGGHWGACMRSVPWSGQVLSPASLSNTGVSESALDLTALEYLANAGYDPPALVSVFERRGSKWAADETVRARALGGSAVPILRR